MAKRPRIYKHWFWNWSVSVLYTPSVFRDHQTSLKGTMLTWPGADFSSANFRTRVVETLPASISALGTGRNIRYSALTHASGLKRPVFWIFSAPGWGSIRMVCVCVCGGGGGAFFRPPRNFRVWERGQGGLPGLLILCLRHIMPIYRRVCQSTCVPGF